jgi:ATP-dependent DNA ligase
VQVLRKIKKVLAIREDTSVRLLSRNGPDWTKRFPWIVEASHKNRIKQFIIDGEAGVLGVTGDHLLTLPSERRQHSPDRNSEQSKSSNGE